MAPLKGVRVLDLSTVMMGPTATQVLASFGADVVKVEAPEGDSMRAVGRPAGRSTGPIFHNINHSKQSIVVDLKQKQGIEVLIALARTADILVFNMRRDAMERLGLGYEIIRKANPDIIYVELTGYGSGGAYAGKPAYDDLIQAAVGIPSLIQQSTGGEPRYIPMAIADRVVGLYAASAILAALHHRTQHGQGQAIEVPMFEVMTQFVLTDHLGGMTYDPPASPPGYMRLLSPDRRPFATLDGYLAVLPYSDQQWRRFLEVAGQPDLYDSDPRLQGMAARTVHIDALYKMIADIVVTRTTDDWVQVLEAIDVPVMRVHDLQSLRRDPHLAEVGFWSQGDHPRDGAVSLMRSPSRWSQTAPRIPTPAPLLGEHTREVLLSAGYSEDDVRALLGARVVSAPSPVAEPAS